MTSARGLPVPGTARLAPMYRSQRWQRCTSSAILARCSWVVAASFTSFGSSIESTPYLSGRKASLPIRSYVGSQRQVDEKVTALAQNHGGGIIKGSGLHTYSVIRAIFEQWQKV